MSIVRDCFCWMHLLVIPYVVNFYVVIGVIPRGKFIYSSIIRSGTPIMVFLYNVHRSASDDAAITYLLLYMR